MYHVPVMLSECLEGLNIKPDGIYADLTFGGGGHSRAILERLTIGKLIAFDQDEEAEKQAETITNPNFIFVKTNFRFFEKYLKLNGIKGLDGILADLGVSSHQIDADYRGFSVRYEGELDMRMNRQQPFSARTLLANYKNEELHKVLGMYGEVRNAKTLAQALVTERIRKPIETTTDLKTILARFAPKGGEFKYYAQVFQALRIEVNAEMKVLEEMLMLTAKVLNPKGRLVVMAYHSLEDRLVKNLMQTGNLAGELEKDFYGNPLTPFDLVNRKPITPSEQELELNKRSRSAKLRVGERKV